MVAGIKEMAGALLGDSGKKSLDAISESDPLFMQKFVVLFAAQNKNATPEQLIAIGNLAQAYASNVEANAKAYGSQFGQSLTQGQIDRLAEAISQNTNIRGEQAKRAAELWAQTNQQLNNATLEGEQKKQLVQISPYETAGKFAGFIYGLGAIIEAIAPGQGGRDMMNNAKNVIDDINRNVASIHLAPPDQAAIINRYNRTVTQFVNQIDLYDQSGATADVARGYGSAHDKDGVNTDLRQMEKEAREGSKKPQAPFVTTPGDLGKPDENPFMVSKGPGSAAPQTVVPQKPVSTNAAGTPDLDALANQLSRTGAVPQESAKKLAAGIMVIDADKNGAVTPNEVDKFRSTPEYKDLDFEGRKVVDQAAHIPPTTKDKLLDFLPGYNLK